MPDLKEVLDIGFVNRTSPNIKRNKRHYLGENKWPSDSKIFENEIETYAENSAIVAQKVLQLLAEGLGAKGAFDDAFGEDALQIQRYRVTQIKLPFIIGYYVCYFFKKKNLSFFL